MYYLQHSSKSISVTMMCHNSMVEDGSKKTREVFFLFVSLEMKIGCFLGLELSLNMFLLEFFFLPVLVFCTYTHPEAFENGLIFIILVHISLPFLINVVLQVIIKVHWEDVCIILFLVILFQCLNSIFALLVLSLQVPQIIM